MSCGHLTNQIKGCSFPENQEPNRNKVHGVGYYILDIKFSSFLVEVLVLVFTSKQIVKPVRTSIYPD